MVIQLPGMRRFLILPCNRGNQLIQLAPTSGGAKTAESMDYFLAPFFVNIFSHDNLSLSETQNPYGPVQEYLYNNESTAIINSIFPSIITYRASNDEYSLEGNEDLRVKNHYWNGIGQHFVTIPGTIHKGFTNSRELISKLKQTF